MAVLVSVRPTDPAAILAIYGNSILRPICGLGLAEATREKSRPFMERRGQARQATLREEGIALSVGFIAAFQSEVFHPIATLVVPGFFFLVHPGHRGMAENPGHQRCSAEWL